MVQRIQTTKRIIQRVDRLTKRGVREGGLDKAKIRVVENIEKLRAELQIEPVMNWKLTLEGHVGLPRRKAAYKVSWRIARPAPPDH